MRQRLGVLAFDRWPALLAEHSFDLVLRRQRMEQRLHEAEACLAAFADELDRGQVHLICTHLAVADDAVTLELKTSKAKVFDFHSRGFFVRTSHERRQSNVCRPCDIAACFE